MTKRLNGLFILLDGVLDHGVLELDPMRLKEQIVPILPAWSNKGLVSAHLYPR